MLLVDVVVEVEGEDWKKEELQVYGEAEVVKSSLELESSWE